MVFTDIESFKGQALLNNFAGFNYSDVIELKEDYKNALLATGIGFDGNINYNICFKAIFNEPEVSGPVLFKVNGLFDTIADLKYNLVQDGTFYDMDLKLGSTWNIDLSNPTVHSTTDTLKFCDADVDPTTWGVYDPLWNCGPGSAHAAACSLMGRTPNGNNIGDWQTPVTFDYDIEQTVAAPYISDYYFKTSYDTWTTALLTGRTDSYDPQVPVACAKFYPVNCVSEEILPFTPEIQEKLIQLSAQGTEKSNLLQSLVNTLTLGASQPFFEGLSGSTSTSDLKQLLLGQLTGEDMLSFNDKIDPALLPDLNTLLSGDLSEILGLLNKQEKDTSGIDALLANDLNALLSFLGKEEGTINKDNILANLIAKLNPLGLLGHSMGGR